MNISWNINCNPFLALQGPCNCELQFLRRRCPSSTQDLTLTIIVAQKIITNLRLRKDFETPIRVFGKVGHKESPQDHLYSFSPVHIHVQSKIEKYRHVHPNAWRSNMNTRRQHPFGIRNWVRLLNYRSRYTSWQLCA